MPGCIPGAWLSDYLGPRKTLGYVVAIQGLFGFLFAGVYGYINQPRYVGGMIASKTSATAVRGQYYGIAAAIGKIGAFAGNRVLLILYNKYADTDPTKAGQYPFFISSAMCLLSAALCLGFLPDIGQSVIDEEDAKFKSYLVANGFDISKMGVAPSESTENIVESGKVTEA
ncbi:glycerophosphoinositol permease [Oleoguttula sp. CCFEE 5521]